MRIAVQTPSVCTTEQLNAFHRLVSKAGQVDTRGLERRIKNSHALVFLTVEESLAGVAAIKGPSPQRLDSVFKKATVQEMAPGYSMELGWVVVDDPFRDMKLSRHLVGAAIGSAPSVRLFATSRNDNEPMHHTLSRFGFKRVGLPYPSVEEDTMVSLFVQMAAFHRAV